MTQPLEALLARVEGATGPDREIDHALMDQFYKWGWRKLGVQESGPKGWRYVRSYCWVDPASKRWLTTDKQGFEFTGSLDRALALVERLLPGWRWLLTSHGYDGGQYQDGPGAKLFHPLSSGSVTAAGYAKTPALSAIAALLRALISQQKTAQGEGV